MKLYVLLDAYLDITKRPESSTPITFRVQHGIEVMCDA